MGTVVGLVIAAGASRHFTQRRVARFWEDLWRADKP